MQKNTAPARLRFHGHGNRPKKYHENCPETHEPYIATEELIEVVNLALHLNRPLLLEGEAGCGKTKLARAVAYELGLPFYPWYVNSGTRLQEGLYAYDALQRLRDAQLEKAELKSERNPENIEDYIEYGALGKAFQSTMHRAVVLIDEIDKASIDFPNDLLTVLDDDYKFTVPEIKKEIKPPKGLAPIIFITSNREKGDLPEPFLRRCLYYFVEFPDDAMLKRIVEAHYKEDAEAARPSGALQEKAVARFRKLREAHLRKSPGTSEFLDWLEALQSFRGKPYPLKELSENKPAPYSETLFKVKEDRDAHRQQFA